MTKEVNIIQQYFCSDPPATSFGQQSAQQPNPFTKLHSNAAQGNPANPFPANPFSVSPVDMYNGAATAALLQQTRKLSPILQNGELKKYPN